MFQDVADTVPLEKGLYRVEIGLYSYTPEIPAMKEMAARLTPWNVGIAALERLPTTRAKFRAKFPRTNQLDPRTGLDQSGGVYLVRKGYDSGTRRFWCLVAVTAVERGAVVGGLYDGLLYMLPGLLAWPWSNRTFRDRSHHPLKGVRFARFVGSAATQPGYQTPATPQPSTGVKPIPAPAPTTPVPTAPKPTTPKSATTPVQKVTQTAKTTAAKTAQTTKAVTAKASAAARQNPWAVVAGIGAGLLLLSALQRRTA